VFAFNIFFVHNSIGHSFLVVSFGEDSWKTAIALNKESYDTHRVCEELEVGDVLNVILTSEPQAIGISKERVYMNVLLKQF
jgi:hypothetical protein